MSAGCGALVALLYWSILSPLQRFRVPGQRLFAVSKATACGKCVCSDRGSETTHWRYSYVKLPLSALVFAPSTDLRFRFPRW